MLKIKNSTIMVTGGAGHIGSHIVDELLKEGVKKIVIYDNLSEGRESNLEHIKEKEKLVLFRDDVRDYGDVEEAMKDCDYVFHVASVLLLEAKAKPRKAIDINIIGTYNIIKAALKTGIKKIVFTSTGSVYGDPSYLPTDENHPYNSETIYGTTKIAGEHLFRDFHKSDGLSYVGLRLHNVYGPRQHYKGAYAQIIPRWLDIMNAGSEGVTIFGDGMQTMDMTYVIEVAKAHVLALKSNVNEGFINIASGRQVSVKYLFDLMKELTNYKFRPKYSHSDSNVVKIRQASTEKAEKLIGFKLKIQIEEGIPLYYEWRKKYIYE